MEVNKTVIIDSNAYTAFRNERTEAIDVVDNAETLCITPIVFGELLGGFAAGTKKAENKQHLSDFLSFPKVVLVDITAETSQHYATIYLHLRNAGTPIPTNDMWIAALARQLSAGVFTYDKHFEKIEGLRLIRTKEDLLRK
jgi:predicted nucleic acid-binding protein